jgi:hypothetical protein
VQEEQHEGAFLVLVSETCKSAILIVESAADRQEWA